jgi:hypothetical protein
MATKDRSEHLWAAAATEHMQTGAMRARAKRRGLITDDEPMSMAVMRRMRAMDEREGNTTHIRQDVMAMNLQHRKRR